MIYRHRHVLLFCLALSGGLSVNGQVSLLVGYERLDVGRWNLLEGPSGTLLKDGLTLGLASEFHFEDAEWSLVPTLLYSHFRYAFWRQYGLAETQMSGPGIQLGLRLFPLHFLLDCTDCQSLQDGWFLEPQLGVQHWRLQMQTADLEVNDHSSGLLVGFKTGFVLQYGPHWRVSPVFSYRYCPEVSWDGLGQLQHRGTDPYFLEQTAIRFHSIEIRLAYIFHEKAP